MDQSHFSANRHSNNHLLYHSNNHLLYQFRHCLDLLVDDESQDEEFDLNYTDDEGTFLPDTDAQGWEELSVKKQRRRTKTTKKRSKTVLLDEETPKRRPPLSKGFHKNKENQRLDSHNNMAGGHTRKQTAGKKKQVAR